MVSLLARRTVNAPPTALVVSKPFQATCPPPTTRTRTPTALIVRPACSRPQSPQACQLRQGAPRKAPPRKTEHAQARTWRQKDLRRLPARAGPAPDRCRGQRAMQPPARRPSGAGACPPPRPPRSPLSFSPPSPVPRGRTSRIPTVIYAAAHRPPASWEECWAGTAAPARHPPAWHPPA